MLPIHSFAPLVLPSSRILVLGSMPGRASLRAGAYYAHPRNAFWSIVAAVGGAPAGAPYDARVEAMLSCGIALWDVASSCVRPGSLDADIDDASVVPNDVAGLLAAHPSIARVCLNGGKAAALFRRHVEPALALVRRGQVALDVRRLPSTSPAHAGQTTAQKQAAWLAALALDSDDI
jgi:hypoxanthine-DNA glycosylase